MRFLTYVIVAVMGTSMFSARILPARTMTTDNTAPVVVELFTSQGCSSCPPADVVLKNLSQRSDVIALSFHVDYWNYIGWKDPFSDARYTQRQRDYGRAMNLRSIYTPQVVIDGQYDVVGSYEDEVLEGIEQAKSDQRRVDIVLANNNPGHLTVSLPALATPLDTEASVLAVFYDGEHVTPVKRGENAGATLSNVHVVREMRDLGRYDGSGGEYRLDYAELLRNGHKGLAILIQQGKGGPIIGAVDIPLADS